MFGKPHALANSQLFKPATLRVVQHIVVAESAALLDRADVIDIGRALLRRPKLALKVSMRLHRVAPFKLSLDDTVVEMKPDCEEAT